MKELRVNLLFIILLIFSNVGCQQKAKSDSGEIILDKQNINKFHAQIIEAGRPDSSVRKWLAKFDTIKNPSNRMELIYKRYLNVFVYSRDIGDDKVLPAELLFGRQNFIGDCDDFAVGLYAISKALNYNGRLCFVQFGNKKGHVFFQLRLCPIEQKEVFKQLPSIVANPFFDHIECDDTYCWLTLEDGFPPKRAYKVPAAHEIQITTSGELKEIGNVIN